MKNKSDISKSKERNEVLEFIKALGYKDSDLLDIESETTYKGDFVLNIPVIIEHTTFESSDFVKNQHKMELISKALKLETKSFHSPVDINLIPLSLKISDKKLKAKIPEIKKFIFEKISSLQTTETTTETCIFECFEPDARMDFAIKFEITFSSQLTKSNIAYYDRCFSIFEGIVETIKKKEKTIISSEKLHHPNISDYWLILYDRDKRNIFRNEDLGELSILLKKEIGHSFLFKKIFLDFKYLENDFKRHIVEFNNDLNFKIIPLKE
jgi:hypothetical protein